MKTLVIAEKPSVAQDIVRAITPTAGKFEKHDEYFESDTHEGILLDATGDLRFPEVVGATVVGRHAGDLV